MSPKLLNILLILIPIVLYYGVYDPYYNGVPGLVWTPEKSFKTLKSEHLSYSNKLNQIDLIAKEADLLYKDYQNIDPEKKKKVETMLTSSIDPLKLRTEVVTISNKSGVAIGGLNITPLSRGVPAGLEAYMITFSMRVQYDEFKAIMDNYEKNLRFYVLDGLTITRVSDKEVSEIKEQGGTIDKDSLNIRVTLKVFSLKNN